jgi:hypothetical protein
VYTAISLGAKVIMTFPPEDAEGLLLEAAAKRRKNGTGADDQC